MNYKAFYRSYRPSSFDQVVGQDHIVRTLVNLIKMNKISHGYLFSGPRGTGKTSVAKIFASAINCVHSERPEQICILCQQNTNKSLDIIEIDAASNNGVNDIRTIREQVEFGPTNSPYKVYIIDEVHMLTTAAFNALLMTLEEPPSHVIFILATTNPDRIPETILSRVQKYNFKRINHQVLEQQLKYIFKNEQIESDEESIDMIASLANGSLRDALSIADQVNAYANSKITINNLIEIFGLSTKESQIHFLNLLAKKAASELLEFFDNLVSGGIDISRFASAILDVLKDYLVFKSTANPSLVSYDPILLKSIILSDEAAYRIIDLLIPLINEIKNSDIPYQLFQLAIIKICAFDETLIDLYQSNDHMQDKGVVSITKPINLSHQKTNQVQQDNKNQRREEETTNNSFKDITNEYFGSKSLDQKTSTILEDFSKTKINEKIGSLIEDFSITEEVRKKQDQEIINNIEEKLKNVEQEKTIPLSTTKNNTESQGFSFKTNQTSTTEKLMEQTTEILNISHEIDGNDQEVDETILNNHETSKQTIDTNLINLHNDEKKLEKNEENSKINPAEERFSFNSFKDINEQQITKEATKEFVIEEKTTKDQNEHQQSRELSQPEIINLFLLSKKETFPLFKDKLAKSSLDFNEEYETYVILLKEAQFICSSNDFILVSSNDEWIINDINNKVSETAFQKFIAKHFGNNIHFYAITKKDYVLSKDLYRELEKSGNIPVAKPLEPLINDFEDNLMKKNINDIEIKSRPIFGKLFNKKE